MIGGLDSVGIARYIWQSQNLRDGTVLVSMLAVVSLNLDRPPIWLVLGTSRKSLAFPQSRTASEIFRGFQT